MRTTKRLGALVATALLCVGLPTMASAAWEDNEVWSKVKADFDGYPSEHLCFYQSTTEVVESEHWSGSGPLFKLAPRGVRYDRGGPECPNDWPEYIILTGWVKHWFKLSDGTWDSWPPAYTQHVWQMRGETGEGATFNAHGRVRHTPTGCQVSRHGPLFYGPLPGLGWPCSW